MDIDKLEGREMDALVAERVMGCEKVYWRELNGNKQVFCDCLDEFDIRGRLHEARNANIPMLLAYYSTDIAAAWLVEERIKELGLIEEYCMQLNRIANNTWDWRDGMKNALLWQLIHATPEDRCRAALKALDRK